MSLAKQKQKMMEDYLQSGQKILPEAVVVKVMIPFFETVAKLLKLEKVYFWADPAQDKICIFVLQNPKNPQEIKQTIYFFASEQDAKRHPHFDQSCHRVDKLPIMVALFQVLTIADEVDQAIFYNQKGRLKESKVLTTEKFISDFQKRCQAAAITQSVAKTVPFGLA